jgi:hypothetical protein
VLALAAWSMSLDQLVGGVHLRPLTLTVPMAALDLLLYAVLQRLPRQWWAMPAVAIGLIVVAWPLTGLGSAVEANRLQVDRNHRIETADFEIYEPLAIEGYTSEGIRFLGPYGDGQPYSEWKAFGAEGRGGLRSSYTLRTFRVPDGFNPPTSCGSDRPNGGLDGWPCSEVGRTGRGEPVWVDVGATFSNVQTFYIRRSETLITVETGVPRGLTAPDVVDLVNRLQPAN